MIKAVIFDLDGTLVQTEVLKADSYAKAITSLTNKAVKEDTVRNVFEKYVGLSREDVVSGLVSEFKKELKNALNIDEVGILKKSLIEKRLSIYHKTLEDTSLLSKHFCPFNLALLSNLSDDDFYIALATMSHLREVDTVITAMGIRNKIDLVLTRDDVKEGKPDPEIYIKAKKAFNLQPQECLVIEDSTNGIKAGLEAGMHVFAVTNEVTKKSVHKSNLLNKDYIIDDLKKLNSTIYHFIQSQI